MAYTNKQHLIEINRDFLVILTLSSLQVLKGQHKFLI
jgi:hypothetical protein